MKLNELCNLIVAEKSAKLIRPKKDNPGQYDYKELFTGSKKGWAIFDLFTASAVKAVWDALSPANRDKLNNMPPLKVSAVWFKLLK